MNLQIILIFLQVFQLFKNPLILIFNIPIHLFCLFFILLLFFHSKLKLIYNPETVYQFFLRIPDKFSQETKNLKYNFNKLNKNYE